MLDEAWHIKQRLLDLHLFLEEMRESVEPLAKFFDSSPILREVMRGLM